MRQYEDYEPEMWDTFPEFADEETLESFESENEAWDMYEARIRTDYKVIEVY